MPRKRKIPSSSTRKAESPSRRRKYPSRLFTSFSLSLSLLLNDKRRPLPPLAAAVNSPTITRQNRGESPNLGPITSPDENPERQTDNRSEAVDDRSERAEKLMRTIYSSGEDAVALQENKDAYNAKDEDSLSYEPKTQKQTTASNYRKQRRRQKQQPQEISNIESDGNSVKRQHGSSHQAEYDAYMHWCHKVLGISSVVEIKEFEYLDHLQMHWEERDNEESYSLQFDWLEEYTTSSGNRSDVGIESESVELPTEIVRGLAARHDINIGDVVISIPLYSLLSIPTTIDHDPVLSRILGPDARNSYGWTDTAEYELPLLVLAVLYHRSLGRDSPLHHYMEILLGTNTDMFPFLWSDEELREKTGGDAGEEVRKMARGMRGDLYEMYDTVVGTLVRERPEWFAPPVGYFNGNSLNEDDAEENNEWTYSYDNFQWAFALVISRHHYLPIQDFDDGENDDDISLNKPTAQNVYSPSQQMEEETQQTMQETLSTVSEVVPPANQPTDSWVDLAKNEERVVEDNLVMTDDDMTAAPQSLGIKHSFLAPLADLINFGPPCLTGSYNAEDHAFDLIATCPFTKGQEVTFWYSSDCSDIIIANFGFLHPLVPPCAAPEDWEKKSEEWKEETKIRESELWEAYRKMDMLKEEMSVLDSQLVNCGCDDGEKKQPIDSMPTASSSENAAAEANHKLRRRGRINEQTQLNQEMMEELG